MSRREPAPKIQGRSMPGRGMAQAKAWGREAAYASWGLTGSGVAGAW